MAVVLVATAALVYASVASAHAHVSPPIVVKGESQVFTLAVPTEKENATTTKVELTPPDRLLDRLVHRRAGLEALGAADGLRRGRRDHEGHVGRRQGPDRRGHRLPFLGRTDSAKTYTFGVRQTYSDGSVVDWTGAESSDAPAPTVEANDSLGGGGSSIVTWIALAVGVLARVLARRRARSPARGGARSRETDRRRRARGGRRGARVPAAAWAHAALLRTVPSAEPDGEHAAEAAAADVQRGGRAAVRDRLGDGRGTRTSRRPGRRAASAGERRHARRAAEEARARAGTSSGGA